MRILIDIGHPGHVHFFKHFIWEMEKRGDEILLTARDKEVAIQLLNLYKFDYLKIGSPKTGSIHLIREWIERDFKILQAARNFRPDILLGIGNPSIAHVATVVRKPAIIFTDTEHARFGNSITFPFASSICTPSCYRDDIGQKQIRYNGYHELAYLHPNQFAPNPAVLAELGLAEGDPFIIVRFVSWQASHDVGHHGIRDKVGLVKALEQYGRVIITSEGVLPPELEEYRMRVSPEKLHDLLYYATLYVGEGATTASECAVLGTPSIYVSSLVGTMGNFIELEENYGLMYSFTDGNAALSKAIEILKDSSSKEQWRGKQKRLLEDKIDVTAFMIWFVESYPRSCAEMKEKSTVQYSFSQVPGDKS